MGYLADLVAPWLGERRSYWLGPWGSGDKALTAVLGRGAMSAAGVSVNERSALNLSAVWAAVSMIAGATASLPLFFYRRIPDGKEQYVDHPLYWLLHDEPNDEMGTFVFRELLTAHVLLWGNAYAEIQRNEGGQVTGLWPITPDRVTPYRDTSGALRYSVDNGTAPAAVLGPDRLLHLHGLGFDGVRGYSVISMARQSLGLTIAAEKFGAHFFGNGAHASLVAQHPGRITEGAQKRFKDSLKDALSGDNALSIVVLEEGITIERVTIPPDDAQFLETRKLQTEEIARWFNIPPHKIKDLDRSTNNNIEQQAIEYVQDTLEPWLKRWENELTRKLVRPLEKGRQWFEFQVKGRLRGDTAAQTDHYVRMAANGFYMIDEVRALEGLNPLPNGLGQRCFIQGAMVPLDRIDETIDAQTRRPDPAPTPRVDGDQPEDRAALIRVVAEEIARALPPPPSVPPALPPAPDPELVAVRDGMAEVRERVDGLARAITDVIGHPAPDLDGAVRAVVEAVTPDLVAIRERMTVAPPEDPRIARVIERLDDVRADLPPPLDLDAVAERITTVLTPALATVGRAAQDATRQLLAWQHAMVAHLVGRMVRREVAHARKIAADPNRADERIAAFLVRFQADAMDDLRPWLMREGSGVREESVAAALERWAGEARNECMAALASGTMPELVRRWENGRADAKAAALMEVLYGPAAD